MKECYNCHTTDEETTIHKCVMCFKLFCENCGESRGGRWFCSKNCCDYFFFGDVD